jgi:hypothetical protein
MKIKTSEINFANEELHDCDAARFYGCEGHTSCGMDTKSLESLGALLPRHISPEIHKPILVF